MNPYRKLDAADRPKAYYQYEVTGKGMFPEDMLRYDSCWPVRGTMFSMFEGPQPERTITIGSYYPPTVGRWKSFGWQVKS